MYSETAQGNMSKTVEKLRKYQNFDISLKLGPTPPPKQNPGSTHAAPARSGPIWRTTWIKLFLSDLGCLSICCFEKNITLEANCTNTITTIQPAIEK